ncbi:hypothetical protein OF375_02865 [Ureaplasma miroungigenitalium]|uniref:hypothetical protein n=1 Tax=Ureaplasma miroungigenitalium TaxID=1042321 RepID=UPI0021E783C5|nr:hypothetical protein [Ureaplasma miroungigenitalium]MCV3734506.1 hypothetical protein [Ureaplasma miroungigenitalium]
MSSVTYVVAHTKQPYGGYLPPKLWKEIKIPNTQAIDNTDLDNLYAPLIGMTVDYLSRFFLEKDTEITKELLLSNSQENPLRISYLGSWSPYAKALDYRELYDYVIDELWDIEDIDNNIGLIYFLSQYDSLYRSNQLSKINPSLYDLNISERFTQIDKCAKQEYIQLIKDNLTPSQKSIIKAMAKNVETLCEYLKDNSDNQYVEIGFTIPDAYTSKITNGDGDLIIGNYLCDIKVSKYSFTSKYTLQLLIYYLMGLKSSKKAVFEKIKYLALYNPRMNLCKIIDVSTIDKNVIDEVNLKVIGYN